MYMAEGLDTGDMISRVELPIEDEDTSGTLFEKLSLIGRDLLKAEMPRLVSGRLQATPQDDSQATYAPNLSREDERIDWNAGSRDIYNRIRGLVPFSGAFTLWNGETFKVWAAAKPDGNGGSGGTAAPGTVLAVNENGVDVKTGDGALRLTTIQPAGKKAMSAADFSRGATLKPGTVLG
ncbi:Methionyl-tRNA formyltransferase [compost metagenome]